jgi:hypothetical protein
MADEIVFTPIKTKSFEVTAAAKEDAPVEYWSNPTKAEIAFGHGATHYRDFRLMDVLKKDGTIKRWVRDTDGRRWYYSKITEWRTLRTSRHFYMENRKS